MCSCTALFPTSRVTGQAIARAIVVGKCETASLTKLRERRIKADEAVRIEASRLWNCRRGPEPEKCQ